MAKHPRYRLVLPVACALASVALVRVSVAAPTAPSSKPEPPPEPTKLDAAYDVIRHERRAGFTFGIAPALTLGTVAGYPNDARKIGRAAYYTQTGVGVGGAGSFWLGGALTDGFTFGAGLSGNYTSVSGDRYTNVSFIFHLEAFPLFPLGGQWREVGLFGETGLGSASLAPVDDSSKKLVDSGAVSRLALGVFYEGLRFSRFSAGPFASMEYVWSDSLRHGAALLGFRTVLYARKVPYPPPAATRSPAQ